MVINFLTNTFGSYKRQDISVQSWMYIKDLFKDAQDVQVNWYDLQFKSEEQTFKSPYPDLETVFCLSDSKDVVTGATKNLPFLNEIFEYGLSLYGDYFVIHNSDIIISKQIVDDIFRERPETLSYSRLDIQDVNSFDDIIHNRIKPIFYCVGHDLFVFRKDWALEYKDHFSVPYLMGKPSFDLVWAGLIKLFGDNKPFGNKMPASVLHIKHEQEWMTASSPEAHWNADHTNKNPIHIIAKNMIDYYALKCLVYRTPSNTLFNESPQERKWEEDFFRTMSCRRKLI